MALNNDLLLDSAYNNNNSNNSNNSNSNNNTRRIPVSDLINHNASPTPPPSLPHSAPSHNLASPQHYSSSAPSPSSSVRTPDPAYSPTETIPTTPLVRASPIRKHHSLSPPSHHNTIKNTTRGPWRIEEDTRLIQLVHKYGPRAWTYIANHLPNRSGKQARERWLNQLDPSLKKKNWTAEEDTIILKAHANYGKKWSTIAKKLPGRTDNSVKNRFNSTLQRAIRETEKAGGTVYIDDIINTLHSRPFFHHHHQHHHHHHQHSQHSQHPHPYPHPDATPYSSEFYYRPTNTTRSSDTYDSTTSDERDLWVRGANSNTRMVSRIALAAEQQYAPPPPPIDIPQCRDACLPAISPLHAAAPSIINETANNTPIR